MAHLTRTQDGYNGTVAVGQSLPQHQWLCNFVTLFVLSAIILSTALRSSELLSQRDRTNDHSLQPESGNAVEQPSPSPQTISDLEDRLLAAIRKEQHIPTRNTLFQQLQLIATPQTVPALVQMLSDTNLSHGARSVLEALPGQAPTTALCRALNDTRNKQLIGVISSLGNRRSRDAVPSLTPLLTNSEVPVVAAVVSALGKIASNDALAALNAVACATDPPLLSPDASGIRPIRLAPRVRYRLNMGAVVDALLECAEVMSQQGRTDDAAQICARLASSQVAPWTGRVAAIASLARLDTSQAMPFVLGMMREPHETFQVLGASFTRTMQQPALDSLFTMLYACPIPAQMSVVESLADRGDPASVHLLLKATRFPDPQVQIAAARSLARFAPNPEMVQRLAELASADGPQADAATESLAAFPDNKADSVILASLNSTNDSVMIGLIRAAAQRSLAAALPVIVRASSSNNPRLRSTAIQALGRLGGPVEFEFLRNRATTAPSGTNLLTIINALCEIARRLNEIETAARIIVDLLPAADAQTKPGLYDCLGKLGGTTALNAVRQAAATTDTETKKHAIELLINWPDASALDELIALAKTEYDPSSRSIVLRGFTNLIARPSARTPDQTFELYAQALQVALTPNEKKFIIPGLASLALPDARDLLKSFLSQQELHDEAGKGIVKCIVDLLAQSPSKAKEEIAKLRGELPASELHTALDELWSLIANPTNSIGTWLTAGPYTNDNDDPEQLLETPFPPEEPAFPVDWNALLTPKSAPIIVLASSSTTQVIYLASSIASDCEQRAKLRLLVRTPIRIWINDVPANAIPVNPRYLESHKFAHVTLRKGENRLVIKLPLTEKPGALICNVDAPNPVRILTTVKPSTSR